MTRVWIEAVFRTYDTAVVGGASSEDVLQNIARLMCGKEDDGYGGARRETAKQLVVSALVAREMGADPLDFLDHRFM